MSLTHRILSLAFVGALSLVAGRMLVTAPRLQAAPEPSVVNQSWELTFKYNAPERLLIAPEGKTEKQTYWFIRYTVTNNSGRDVLFTPDFQLLTDSGQIITAGKGVDASVYKEIQQLYKNPLLEDPFQILGKILQGEDNAKDGVIVFTGVDTEARDFRIAISGLSGDTAEVTNPLTNEKVVLHKSLMLHYSIPGEAINIDPRPQFKGKKWVLR